ncbi:rRNA binding [Trichomonas vaginalis G3]|uniref:rRNA binding n=1 Tax=Trichomonas vaginalis (strain ATCC PRA-98 / G3) TaxID=412133 RepID=UPI0021E56496|nr:rRNA binding [Trichomonas vaginalis G3]KAI5525878.1 rRNA binding [Trichomonas vaginalis G3]
MAFVFDVHSSDRAWPSRSSHNFLASKKHANAEKKQRYVKSIGLKIETPKTAEESVSTSDAKCPFTGTVSIRGRPPWCRRFYKMRRTIIIRRTTFSGSASTSVSEKPHTKIPSSHFPQLSSSRKVILLQSLSAAHSPRQSTSTLSTLSQPLFGADKRQFRVL